MKNPTSTFVIINGKLIPAAEATLGIEDLAIVRGYGIFDFFKTVNGNPVFLEDNLDRFYHSAHEMKLTVAYSREEIKQQIQLLQDKNNLASSGIKLLLTGGYSSDGYTIQQPNLILTQTPLKRNVDSEHSGMSLLLYPYHRPFGTVKVIDYSMGIFAYQKAKENGVDDVLYVQDNIISECPRANFFIVNQEAKLITPPSTHILAGITRKKILEFAPNIVEVEERDITIEDLMTSKEAFITSTTKNITPITFIKDIVSYPAGAGPITKQLQEKLNELVYS